jgi:multidrug efflux pump subunit AcrA (membrane-fusion protein)
MATRSASTGVLVTLVIFVILSIALLVVNILQWTQVKSVTETMRKERETYKRLGTLAEVGTDDAKRLETMASASNMALVPYLINLNQQISGQLTGDRGKLVDDKTLGEALKAMGVEEGGSVKSLVTRLKASSETSAAELKSLKDRMDQVKAQLDAASAQTAKSGTQDSEVLAKASQALADLSAAAEAYRTETASLQQAMASAKQDFDQRVSTVTNERDSAVESLKSDAAQLQTQLEQAQKKLSQFDTGLQNPALLVDGRVIEVNGSEGQIFIDLGKQSRLQAGTTFEVFETPEQIRSSGEQGLRGKASIQIMRVGDLTSTARVIRSSPGRPVVRGDLLANAVYSPNHRYRFLVHGKFNIDGDKFPSTDETELIVQRIKDWGGTVSAEDRVTGDLDFVVIGEPPQEPSPLSPTAGANEVAEFQKARLAKEQYEKILSDATRARIPVLNWNRFQSLTGMTD